MMKDHEIILKMIEGVSPDDTAKLDEIDARVWCYLERPNHKYGGIWQDGSAAHFGGKIRYSIYTYIVREDGTHKNYDGADFWCRYTRSRDALKAIRPEGWYFQMWGNSETGEPSKNNDHKAYYDGARDSPYFTVKSPELVSEELAELHAIIQAIAYERNLTDAN